MARAASFRHVAIPGPRRSSRCRRSGGGRPTWMHADPHPRLMLMRSGSGRAPPARCRRDGAAGSLRHPLVPSVLWLAAFSHWMASTVAQPAASHPDCELHCMGTKCAELIGHFTCENLNSFKCFCGSCCSELPGMGLASVGDAPPQPPLPSPQPSLPSPSPQPSPPPPPSLPPPPPPPPPPSPPPPPPSPSPTVYENGPRVPENAPLTCSLCAAHPSPTDRPSTASPHTPSARPLRAVTPYARASPRSWFGNRDEAVEKCSKSPRCEWLHDVRGAPIAHRPPPPRTPPARLLHAAPLTRACHRAVHVRRAQLAHVRRGDRHRRSWRADVW